MRGAGAGRVPLVVIGNKTDAPRRAVAAETAKRWCAAQPPPVLYFEASASSGRSIDPIFDCIADSVLRARAATAAAAAAAASFGTSSSPVHGAPSPASTLDDTASMTPEALRSALADLESGIAATEVEVEAAAEELARQRARLDDAEQTHATLHAQLLALTKRRQVMQRRLDRHYAAGSAEHLALELDSKSGPVRPDAALTGRVLIKATPQQPVHALSVVIAIVGEIGALLLNSFSLRSALA